MNASEMHFSQPLKSKKRVGRQHALSNTCNFKQRGFLGISCRSAYCYDGVSPAESPDEEARYKTALEL
jgi:hypothetical protein